jgi:methylated-DNA-[protein]-cysteine S-methyltransferase
MTPIRKTRTAREGPREGAGLEAALRRAAPDDGAEEAARRFAAAASATGALDVAYTVEPSPVGDLFLAASRTGLVEVGFHPEDVGLYLEQLAWRVSPRVMEAPGRLDPVRRQLDEYFAGRRRDFDVPVDWALARSGFGRRVLRATARIPFGGTLTYRDVATRAGNPAAVRAAGNALGANPVAIVVPCHRVLRTGGGLGGYGGGIDRKRFLLELEGVLAG